MALKAVCHCSRFARAGGAKCLSMQFLSAFACGRGHAWKLNYVKLYSWRTRATDFSRVLVVQTKEHSL